MLARGTVAPLTIVVSLRPVRDLGVDAGEIVNEGTAAALHTYPDRVGCGGWTHLEASTIASRQIRFATQRGRKVTDWIVARQEADGQLGRHQPPWVYSLLALDLMGYGLDHPAMRKGIEGFNRFVIDDGGGWRFQACMSRYGTPLGCCAPSRSPVSSATIRLAARGGLAAARADLAGSAGLARGASDFRGGNAGVRIRQRRVSDIDDTAVVVSR